MSKLPAAPVVGNSMPYQYPTPTMMAGYAAAGRSGSPANNGTSLYQPINTSSLGAPQVQGGRLSFRQRLGILIYGADAAQALFPPQQPLQPVAQPADMGALGRPWNFPVGWNTRVTPRSGQRIGFPFLKALAEYDVVRVMIERVKDDLCKQDWTIGPKDKKATRDARCDQLEDMFAYPDRVHTWRDWLRELLEQTLVYDAPAIWLRPTVGTILSGFSGPVCSLELLDGSLFTPKIMADGRLPPPEFGPAYQQVLHGLPAVDYVQPVPRGQPSPMDPDGQPFPELLLKPRNPRVDIPYGYGPVEQIIRSIEIGMKREEFLLDFYTAGSVPDLMVGAPDSWNPDQIAQFQSWFDSVLSGNLAARRGVRFLPGGTRQPFEPKDGALTDATDEWIVRIMCFAFGLSPMPFVKMMNRASGEQHAEQQEDEGTLPMMGWIADLFNHIIAVKFGWRDIEFRWEERANADPLAEAQRWGLYLNAKVYHPDEVRQKLGDDAMPDVMRAQMDMPTFAQSVNATVLPPEQQQEANDRTEAATAAAAAMKPQPAPGVAGNGAGKSPSAPSKRSTRSARPY